MVKTSKCYVNTLKRLNAGKENKEDWVKDENGLVIEVVVAG